MMRYSLISAVILFLVQCDKFVIDPVHSNPFDELNDNTFGNPFNMWKKNYPDKIQLGWDDLIKEYDMQITGYRLKKISGTNIVDTKYFNAGVALYEDKSNLI